MNVIQVDEHLIDVVVKAARDGLSMAALKPVPIGVNRYFNSHGEVSAIIGAVGQNGGSIILNAGMSMACFMAGQLAGTKYEILTTEALDAFCEIANQIAGKIKALLSTTDLRFERISTPSVVVGSNYFISHYKNMTSVSIDFDLPEMRTTSLKDSRFTVYICLMKVG